MTTSLPTAARRDTALHAVPRGTTSHTALNDGVARRELDRQLAAYWQQLVVNAPRHPHRDHPSDTQVAVLRALHARGGESWCGQLASDTGRDAGNLSRFTLRGLHRIGVLDVTDEREQLRRGGAPTRLIRITTAGRRVVELLPDPRPDVDLDEAA